MLSRHVRICSLSHIRHHVLAESDWSLRVSTSSPVDFLPRVAWCSPPVSTACLPSPSLRCRVSTLFSQVGDNGGDRRVFLWRGAFLSCGQRDGARLCRHRRSRPCGEEKWSGDAQRWNKYRRTALLKAHAHGGRGHGMLGCCAETTPSLFVVFVGRLWGRSWDTGTRLDVREAIFP